MSGVLPAAQDPRFAVFLSWAAAKKVKAMESGKRRDQFSLKTQSIYESLWRGWVDWLDAHGRQWHDASTADLQAFLDGPAPASPDRAARRPIETTKMANYTQQRFWRVLQSVYTHAVLNELIAHSPCADIARKPRITERSQQRQLLHPGVLELLRDPAELACFLPMEDPRQWWVLRDRAAVALAAHCGLSTGELVALRGCDLRDGVSVLATRQLELPGLATTTPAMAVDIPGTRDRLPHSVPIPEEAMTLIEPWLARRAQMLRDLQHAFAPGGGALRPPGPAQAPLLLSRETRPGEAVSAVDAKMVWHTFRRCVVAAIEAAGHELAGTYVARGPGILRNSVIAHWTATLGPAKAAELAGLKPGSLRAAGRPAAEART